MEFTGPVYVPGSVSNFFELTRPTVDPKPLLVEVPHAGLAVPAEMEPWVAVSFRQMQRDADIYVDRLYAGAHEFGATMLVAQASRYIVDLNRAPDDVDQATVLDHPAPKAVQPRGVVWRMTTDGSAALTRPLKYADLLHRLDRFHTPYHGALEQELIRLREQFGYAVLLAAHSMPSVGRSGHADTGRGRADIVPGTRGRTTASSQYIDLVDAHFRAAGLSVRHDEPYRGGWTTGHYGRPEAGWHAIQIELNRALYVDEATAEIKEPEFHELRSVLLDLVRKLGAA